MVGREVWQAGGKAQQVPASGGWSSATSGVASAGGGATTPRVTTFSTGSGVVHWMHGDLEAGPGAGVVVEPVPVATGPGRGRLEGRRSLACDANAGPGLSSVGWLLGRTSITRGGDGGVPQSLDAADSDTCLLGGVAGPMLELASGAERAPDAALTACAPHHRLPCYVPRTAGLFASLPDVDWQDPSLRFETRTGDGHPDAVLTAHEVSAWVPSRAERGFAPALGQRQAAGEGAFTLSLGCLE